MTNTSDGTVLHINCAAKKTRTDLTLRVSEDGMKTYTDYLIDERAGYSDVAADAARREAYILYERDVDDDGLYFTTVTY
jgi:hypothetical protein